MKKNSLCLLVCAVSIVFLCEGCSGDYMKGFREGEAEAKRSVLNTDVGSAENRGTDAQYQSEEFRYKRGGLLGSQLMKLEPKADEQLERQGYVDDITKKQLRQVYDELAVIATINKDEKELLFIEKSRKTYGL